jgi:hypothetical protein
MPLSSLVSILKSAVTTGSDIFDRYQRWKLLGKDVDAKLRLFYLECRRNLSLLDCIKMKNEAGAFINDKELLKTARLLNVDVLELVFMDGEKSHHLFEILSSPSGFQCEEWEEMEANTPSDNLSKKRTLLQLAMFVYVRIMVLKDIAELKDGQTTLKNMKYGVRLSNIKNAYLILVKKLHAHPAIKELEQIDDEPALK